MMVFMRNYAFGGRPAVNLIEIQRIRPLKKIIRETLCRKSNKWGNGVGNEYGVKRLKRVTGEFQGLIDAVTHDRERNGIIIWLIRARHARLITLSLAKRVTGVFRAGIEAVIQYVVCDGIEWAVKRICHWRFNVAFEFDVHFCSFCVKARCGCLRRTI
jgi:hypothetical protein